MLPRITLTRPPVATTSTWRRPTPVVCRARSHLSDPRSSVLSHPQLTTPSTSHRKAISPIPLISARHLSSATLRASSRETRQEQSEDYQILERAQVWRLLPRLGGSPVMLNLDGKEPTGGEILVAEQPLPISIITDFVKFLSHNTLPNGRQNPLPALTTDEIKLFLWPFKEWAPPPFSNDKTQWTLGFALMSASSMEFSWLEHELYFDVKRLWGGLLPVSDSRWKAKGLDAIDPLDSQAVNLFKAAHHLSQTYSAYSYFGIPEVLDSMRTAYNRAYDQFAHFDRAMDAYYSQPNIAPETTKESRGRVADLWAEYFFSHIDFITARTYAWHQEHADAIHQSLLEALKTAPQGTITATSMQKNLRAQLKLIEDAKSIAIHQMFIPLAGFKNELSHLQHLSSPPDVDWTKHTTAGDLPLTPNVYPPDLNRRHKITDQRLRALEAEHKLPDLTLAKFTSHLLGLPKSLLPTSHAIHRSLSQTALELRGPPPNLTSELWITRLRTLLNGPETTPAAVPRKKKKWGFIGYRLSYTPTSDAQWSAFLSAFQSKAIITPLSSALGAAADEDIISACSVAWIDGRDHGIPEGDVHAARRHYESLGKSTPSPVDTDDTVLLPNVIVIADAQSISSFVNTHTVPGPPGCVDRADLDGWVTVVETAPSYEAEAPPTEEQRRDAPLYMGSFAVLGSALFGDFWAGLFMGVLRVRDYWPVAAVHPLGVYTGPVAGYQREFWGVSSGMMRENLEGMVRRGEVELEGVQKEWVKAVYETYQRGGGVRDGDGGE